MEFKCELFNIQHIKKLVFNVDLSKNQLMCIVGKNGVGKTTLVRSIKNLQSSDTFTKTASPYIFNEQSQIIYTIDGKEYDFRYNPKLKEIDTKNIIDNYVKEIIYVELPIPHGERFKHFQRLNDIDDKLRKNITLQEYITPKELISFLCKIYRSNRFDNLKEISIKGVKYYFILKDDGFYIREDYLSSGEHFVINLYKMIQRKCKLIVIDEIDISLDASAQVNLLEELRTFCKKYEVNIIFTTHSLAIMKKLSESELYYMENDEAVVTFKKTSYNYVKSVLFGFKGWDKYVLTEDEMLQNYLQYLIAQAKIPIFFEYKIIYIGGAENVVDLMERNKDEQFFSSPENVISVLDGDQKEKRYCKNNNKIFFIPFESVEKQLEYYHKNKELPFFEVIPGNPKKSHKNLYSLIIRKGLMTNEGIFSFINERNKDEVEIITTQLISFLNT